MPTPWNITYAYFPYSKYLLCSRVKSLVVDFRHKFSQVTSSDPVWVGGGEVRRCVVVRCVVERCVVGRCVVGRCVVERCVVVRCVVVRCESRVSKGNGMKKQQSVRFKLRVSDLS